MDMGMMNGGSDYSPLYAQAKEILAAGMLAELKEDADEAMKGEGEEESCPHCGGPMGGPKMGRMGLGMPEVEDQAPAMPPMDLSQFAMRVPPAPMAGAGAPPMPMMRRPAPMPGMGM